MNLVDQHGTPLSEPPSSRPPITARAKVAVVAAASALAISAGALANLDSILERLGLKESWNFYGEPEVAGEFVALGPKALSFDEAMRLRDDLRRLSSMAWELAPDAEKIRRDEFGGTYNGALLFAKSDAQIVRSLRVPQKWEAVIDLVSNGQKKGENKRRLIETQDDANEKLFRIKDEFGIASGSYVLGAIPQDDKQREFYALAKRIWEEYFDGATADKYSTTDYQSIYKNKLVNVVFQEGGG